MSNDLRDKFLRAGGAVQSVLNGESDRFPTSEKSVRADVPPNTPTDANRSTEKYLSKSDKSGVGASTFRYVGIGFILVAVIYLVFGWGVSEKSELEGPIRQNVETGNSKSNVEITVLSTPTQEVVPKLEPNIDQKSTVESIDVTPKTIQSPVAKPGSREHAFQLLYSDFLNDKTNINNWNIPTEILTEHDLSIGGNAYKLYSGRAHLRNSSVQGLLLYQKIDNNYEVIAKSANVNLKDCYVTDEENSAVMVAERNQKLVIGLLCNRMEKRPADQAKLVVIDRSSGSMSLDSVSHYTGGPHNYKLKNFREVEGVSNYWYLVQFIGDGWVEENYYAVSGGQNSGAKCRVIIGAEQKRTDYGCAKFGL